MFAIGSIKWPEDNSSALRLYLEFLMLVSQNLGIDYFGHPNDPVRITRQFLDGELPEEERAKAAAVWWDYVDSREAIRNFKDRDILMARLAICFLTINEKDGERLGENLSWFIEVLGFLGEDVDTAINLMETYFNQRG